MDSVVSKGYIAALQNVLDHGVSGPYLEFPYANEFGRPKLLRLVVEWSRTYLFRFVTMMSLPSLPSILHPLTLTAMYLYQ